MPALLAGLDVHELEALVCCSQLEDLTGKAWKVKRQIDLFFKLFNPRQTADTLYHDEPDPGILRQLVYDAVQKAKG